MDGARCDKTLDPSTPAVHAPQMPGARAVLLFLVTATISVVSTPSDGPA